ncbi:hypothetical protein [Serpentinicella alkaliphila]|uniref:Uncharacterized protein n=1 Tax=Serpentinicella alkaliphila TaxID=1734049 RepID=A0A4R2TQR6_9FIRM|nr:hypothetical protein [Serpentinicella alkaliphila]QUH25806.1 hypothetical protein HZR23_08695 [Serpentinicella alkaliphila]TCP99818.1 hypothetical protein EDD79_10326 [Serpentinicella alkaliphila]
MILFNRLKHDLDYSLDREVNVFIKKSAYPLIKEQVMTERGDVKLIEKRKNNDILFCPSSNMYSHRTASYRFF